MSEVVVHCQPDRTELIDGCLRETQAGDVGWHRGVRPPAKRRAETELRSGPVSSGPVDRARIVVSDDRVRGLLDPLFALARAGRAGRGSISVSPVGRDGRREQGALNFFF